MKCKKVLWVLKWSVQEAITLQGSNSCMMNVALFVSILAAVSFQKHFLYRFSLGNLRSSAEQKTLWLKLLLLPCDVQFWRPQSSGGAFFTNQNLHFFTKDWNHQAPATILFPGFFLLSTTDQETNVWKQISFFLIQSWSSWYHLQYRSTEKLEQSTSGHFVKNISIWCRGVYWSNLETHPFYSLLCYILRGFHVHL